MKVDSRYIALILLAMYAIPVLTPLAIPVKVSEPVRVVYRRIERLQAGDIVMFEISGLLRYLPEIEAGTTAIVKHMFSRKARIVFFSFEAEGTAFYQILMNDVNPASFGAKYGQDYVFLGYIAGGEAAEVAVITDTWAAAPTDYYGTRLEQLPLMQKVHSGADATLLFSVYLDAPEDRVRSYSVKGNFKDDRAWVGYTGGGNVPVAMPFVNAKQILAVLGGAVNGAEYELISGYPGLGLVNTDIISLTHILMMALILVTNIAFFAGLAAKHGYGRKK